MKEELPSSYTDKPSGRMEVIILENWIKKYLDENKKKNPLAI